MSLNMCACMHKCSFFSYKHKHWKYKVGEKAYSRLPRAQTGKLTKNSQIMSILSSGTLRTPKSWSVWLSGILTEENSQILECLVVRHTYWGELPNLECFVIRSTAQKFAVCWPSHIWQPLQHLAHKSTYSIAHKSTYSIAHKSTYSIYTRMYDMQLAEEHDWLGKSRTDSLILFVHLWTALTEYSHWLCFSEILLVETYTPTL